MPSSPSIFRQIGTIVGRIPHPRIAGAILVALIVCIAGHSHGPSSLERWKQGAAAMDRIGKSGSREGALADYAEAIRCYGPDADGACHPELEFVYQKRALFYYQIGERDKARADLVMAASIAPPQDQASIRQIRRDLGLD